MRLGIVSDTHGLLRPEVLEIFADVDQILHAGDVGDEQVLDELEAIAPVTAVYGNTDGWLMRQRLPDVAYARFDDFNFVIVHGDKFGSPDPEVLKRAYPDADVIVYGHTHLPLIRDLPDYSVVINPGSAGPKRFELPVSVAIMETEPGIPPRARIVPLVKSRAATGA